MILPILLGCIILHQVRAYSVILHYKMLLYINLFYDYIVSCLLSSVMS